MNINSRFFLGCSIDEDRNYSKHKVLLLCVLIISSAVALADINTGLIAHYSFDDCTATDNSGGGHDGVIQGSPECVSGIINKSFKFDGVNDSITFKGMDKYFSKNDFSISFFLDTKQSKHENESIVSKRSICNITPYLDIRRFAENINYEMSDGSSDDWLFKSFKKPTGIVFSTMVRKGNTVQIYHNGKLVSKGLKTLRVMNLFSTAPFGISVSPCIGRDGTNMFSGYIDELRIYNRALSPSEVTQLYDLVIPVSGTVKSLGTHMVRCKNESTGQVIDISDNKLTTYNCEAKGLIINPGETASIFIKGIVQ